MVIPIVDVSFFHQTGDLVGAEDTSSRLQKVTGKLFHLLLAWFISNSSSRAHSPLHYNAVNSIAISFINDIIINSNSLFFFWPWSWVKIYIKESSYLSIVPFSESMKNYLFFLARNWLWDWWLDLVFGYHNFYSDRDSDNSLSEFFSTFLRCLMN